ncbi:hypothetical protein BJ508DRAFT_418887 [Ascobolus immersus RN42]|uniref:F-box domain-containing protein n=1 Tax=Ascobolus immersus RN42 TaxID=1160509 RepID=A0A3N4HMQ4_ASCIM|nr:hypothetical protein BJ508DRAFT_418887 [Ascobolus immersus RN42]
MHLLTHNNSHSFPCHPYPPTKQRIVDPTTLATTRMSVSSLLNLPRELQLRIIESLDTYSDLLAIQRTHPFLHELFTTHCKHICTTIANRHWKPLGAVDFLNILRADAKIAPNYILHSIIELPWLRNHKHMRRSRPRNMLSPPSESIGIVELWMLQKFHASFVLPYIDAITAIECRDTLPLSPTESLRLTKAFYAILRMLKRVHAALWDEDSDEPMAMLQVSESGHIYVGNGGSYMDRLLIIDVEGVLRDLTIEEHMHMIYVITRIPRVDIMAEKGSLLSKTSRFRNWLVRDGKYGVMLDVIMDDRLCMPYKSRDYFRDNQQHALDNLVRNILPPDGWPGGFNEERYRYIPGSRRHYKYVEDETGRERSVLVRALVEDEDEQWTQGYYGLAYH